MKSLLFGALLAQLVLAHPTEKEVRRTQEKCTNPKIRREWRSLSRDDRIKYVKSVECLTKAPAKFKKYFPIVKDRYDDFVALHVNATKGGEEFNMPNGLADLKGPPIVAKGIHGTGSFMHWHRYVLNIWEDTLIEECGWEGGMPYWNWHLDSPEAGGEWLKSPLWDPVAGFGGNGKFTNNTKPLVPWTPPGLSGPPVGGGTGGGCLLDGPFKDRELRIGPAGKMDINATTRCITRDFDPKLAEKAASKASIARVLKSKDFTTLRSQLDGPGADILEMIQKGQSPFGAGGPPAGLFGPGGPPAGLFGPPKGGSGGPPAGLFGPPKGGSGGPPAGLFGPPGQGHGSLTASIHLLGHAGIGGEMTDLFNSANDPLFFMHHGGMDYLWALWQEQDPKRIHEYDRKEGGFLNFSPLSADSELWMGVFAPTITAKEVADTLNRDGTGILCVKYEGLPFEKYMS